MTVTTTQVSVFSFTGAGVYMLRCLVNGKVYVGSSCECRRRVKGHFAKLAQGTHRNCHLQAAYNQLGEDAFECCMLEECEDTNLIAREQHWVNHHKARDDDYGYNLMDPVESIGHVRQYVVYPPDGPPMEIENLHKFCRGNGLCSANMTVVAQGASQHHKGWLCRYADTTEQDWIQSRACRSTGQALLKGYGGDYVATDSDGVAYLVLHLAAFCIRHELSVMTAYQSIRHGWKCAGWLFEKINKVEQVVGAVFDHQQMAHIPTRRARPDKGKARIQKGG